MPKPRVVVVEGCPCEVVEEWLSEGIVHGNGVLDPWPWDGRMLVVAPDGSLVMPNPFANSIVDHTQPDADAMTAHLRRLARALAPAPRGGR